MSHGGTEVRPRWTGPRASYAGAMTSADGETRAAQALAAAGIEHTITRHGRVRSLEEAAAARGVAPADIIKTLVVRRADDDYRFVLVPGDREISWPKLRSLLGVNPGQSWRTRRSRAGPSRSVPELMGWRPPPTATMWSAC